MHLIAWACPYTGVIVCLFVVFVAGKEDNLDAQTLLWKRSEDNDKRLLFASSEHMLPPQNHTEALDNHYFESYNENGDGQQAEADYTRCLCGPPTALKLTPPTRKCGEVFANLSVLELQSVASSFIKIVLPTSSPLGAFAPLALQFVSNALKYPIQLQKVCTSCNEIRKLYKGESFLKDASTYGFDKYCEKKRYGSNFVTSGLLMVPIDPTTGKVFAKTLQSAIFTRGTVVGSQHAPTGLFPSNITATLQNTNGTQAQQLVVLLMDIITPLFATSAGAVSILPDFIGYGESYEYPKSYLVYSLYQQASVSMWLAARRMLLSTATVSSQCTALDHAVTINGYLEGGYSAFSTCLAMNKLAIGGSKVCILNCRCGGAPFDMDYVFSYTLEQIQNKSNYLFASVLPIFVGNDYSSTNPDLANSNKGQNVLKDAYKRLAPAWLDSPSVQALIGLSTAAGLLNTLSAGIRDLYLTGTNLIPTRSCSGPGLQRADTRFACQALVDNTLVNALLSANFPTTICHAQDDQLIPFASLPNFSSNPNVKFYQPAFPQLTPVGNHPGGSILCAIGTILAFALPSNASDTPQMMSNLTDPSICKAHVGKPNPGKGPGKSFVVKKGGSCHHKGIRWVV